MQPLAFVLGTRPEIIKVAPVIKAAERAGVPFVLIHTNQHYSAELDTVFFRDLKLNAPDYSLEIGPGTQSAQTARMMERLEPILEQVKPSWVLVQGDTNSVLAGALVGAKLNVPIGHIEAGLRSFDRAMPEEINRIMTDHISSALFAPTEASAELLRKEGIDNDLIHVVGNTVADAVLQNAASCTEAMLEPFGLTPKRYCLLTLHRPSNVDTKEDLEAVLAALETAHAETGLSFFFPVHPRTRGALDKFGIQLPSYVQTAQPVGYFEMLTLQKFAAFAFTDSGGVQEETCILQTPCVTLRENTERPETVEVGANVVVGRDAKKIRAALAHFKTKTAWENPFGDGTTADQILKVVTK